MKHHILSLLFCTLFSSSLLAETADLSFRLETRKGDYEISYKDPEILKEAKWTVNEEENFATWDAKNLSFSQKFSYNLEEFSFTILRKENGWFGVCATFQTYDGESYTCVDGKAESPMRFKHASSDGQSWSAGGTFVVTIHKGK